MHLDNFLVTKSLLGEDAVSRLRLLGEEEEAIRESSCMSVCIGWLILDSIGDGWQSIKPLGTSIICEPKS